MKKHRPSACVRNSLYPPAAAGQTIRMPLRLIEACCGRGNFDDAGDRIIEMLNGLSGGSTPYRLEIEWDDAHSNPWFHAMVFRCETLPVDLYNTLCIELAAAGLTEG